MHIKLKYKQALGIQTKVDEVFISQGLEKHLLKRKHFKALEYIDKIDDIISKPDYIGVSPREKIESMEYIKVYKDNILVALKLDETKGYFYVASMYEVTQSKINSMLKSGRIISIDNII